MAPEKARSYLPTGLAELPSVDGPCKRRSRFPLIAQITLGLLATCFYFSDGLLSLYYGDHAPPSVSELELCPQVEPIAPTAQGSLVEALDAYLLSAEGSEWAIGSLAGAVRVPSVFRYMRIICDVLSHLKHADL